MQKDLFRMMLSIFLAFFAIVFILFSGLFYLQMQNQYQETTKELLSVIPTETYTGSELYQVLQKEVPGVNSIMEQDTSGEMIYHANGAKKDSFTQTIPTAAGTGEVGFRKPNQKILWIRFLPFGFSFFILIPFLCYFLSASLTKRLQHSMQLLLHHPNGKTQKKLEKYPEWIPLAQQMTKLEQQLTETNHQYQKTQDTIRLIQEYMVESILILDDSDRIILANNSAISLLEIDRADWEHKSIYVLANQEQLLATISKSKLTPSVQVLLNLKGRQFQTFVNRIEMTSNYGTIILLVDVTESKQAEKIRRDFTANVSHELKTPLTTIKGFGEMFGSGMISDKAGIKKYGAMIYRESERLLFLINDIMRLSEIEEQTDQITELLSLYDIANEIVDMLSAKMKQMGVSVQFYGTKVCYMKGNENYIRELFTNLIDNAIKYNNPGGSVSITLQSTAEQIIIQVRDTGIGIPEKAQARIFERFYRVDKSRSKERGGTGLGLSIVKHIVELYQGSITLESELGKGTCITIHFPVQEQDSEPTADPIA